MGRTPTVLTEDQRKDIIGAYRRTGSLRATARAVRRGEDIVRRALDEAGVEYVTKQQATAAKMEQVAGAYRALGSINHVSSLLGLNIELVRRALDEAGIAHEKDKATAQATMRGAIKRSNDVARAKRGLPID